MTTENEHRRRRTPRRNGKGSNSRQTLQQTTEHTTGAAANEELTTDINAKSVDNWRIIDFMKIEKPMIVLSVICVIASIALMVIKGLNFGLDFTGGVSASVHYDKPVEQHMVVQNLAKNGYNDAVAQYLGTRQELLLRLPPQKASIEGLTTSLDKALDLPDNNAKINNIDIVGSQVGNQIYLNSLIAVALALGCMLLYVAARFQFKLALGAVFALFHDTVVVLGIFALMGWPFDLTVLAAVLALIGYSLNDTIVIYDRLRENFRRVRGLTSRQIVNLSLTETLRRTIMTVSTVFLVVLAMMFLGGDGLLWFSVALFIGLIVGTYSSVYISSAVPLLMGLSREDFIVKIKPEFSEEDVVFEDPKLR